MAKRQPATQPILVVGHQRPDTDSAVSAAVYAALLNDLARGGEHYEGVMLGEPSGQTRWLFAEAGVPLPRQIGHLHQLVSDVARRDVFSVGPDAALGDALALIMRRRISVVPVLDANNKLLGLLSDRMPMANYFYHANAEDFLGVLFAVADLERYLKLARWQNPEAEAEGQIVLDLSRLAPGSLAVLGDEPEMLRRCRDAGAAMVIACVRKKTVAWKKALRECPDLGVLQYPGSLMALVTQLPMAIPATRLMLSEGFPTLAPDQTIRDARHALQRSPFALPVLEADGTLHGVLSRSEILNAPRRRVVLVDHFEQHQAPEGIANVDIIEIVDHHRVGTLETTHPIRVDCRPVGSTATIVACKLAEHGKRPSIAQAKLLLGAIIADTLLLTSPTTTEVDRQQANALARRARVNLHSFGRDVLVRNDETLERPAVELVEKDLKEFSAEKLRFAVAQIETVDRTRLGSEHLEKFATALRERRQSGGLDFAALLLTDIFRADSIVLFDARTSTLARQLGPGGKVWAGCVSRKKQFLPELLLRLNHRHTQ